MTVSNKVKFKEENLPVKQFRDVKKVGGCNIAIVNANKLFSLVIRKLICLCMHEDSEEPQEIRGRRTRVEAQAERFSPRGVWPPFCLRLLPSAGIR